MAERFERGGLEAGAGVLDSDDGDAVSDSLIFSDGVNWCDRCRVLGLHSDLADDLFPLPAPTMMNPDSERPEPTIKQLMQICVDDPIVRDALDGSPPTSSLGVCERCSGTVQGDRSVVRVADAFLDGTIMNIETPHTS